MAKQRFPEPEYRDVPWAVAFVIYVVVVLAIAAINGPDEGATITSEYISSMTVGAAVGGLSALLLSMLMVKMLQANALGMMKFAIGLTLFVMGAGTLYLFAIGAVLPGIIALIIFLIFCAIFYFFRKRLAFAAATLSAASRITRLYKGVFVVGLGVSVVMLGWGIMWGRFAAPIYFGPNGPSYPMFVLLLLSWYWFLGVARGVIHVSVCGVVSSYYFQGRDNMPPSPSVKAFKRSMTYSFGSICLGGAIIAAVKTLRDMARYAIQAIDSWIIRMILRCLVDTLERLIEYFNYLAFTHIAIYGYGFVDAAKSAWNAIVTKGALGLFNDSIVGLVLFMCALLCGVLAGAISFAFAVSTSGDDIASAMFIVIMGFVVGYMVSSVIFEVLRSASMCMYVCFFEDPNVLERTDKDMYQALMSSHWSRQFRFGRA